MNDFDNATLPLLEVKSEIYIKEEPTEYLPQDAINVMPSGQSPHQDLYLRPKKELVCNYVSSLS